MGLEAVQAGHSCQVARGLAYDLAYLAGRLALVVAEPSQDHLAHRQP